MWTLQKHIRQATGVVWCLLIISFSLSVVSAEIPFIPQPIWGPNGDKVAFIANSNIQIDDAASGRVLFTLQGHTDTITSLAWSPDGKWIASSSNDQTIKLWNATNGQLARTLTGHDEPVTYVLWLGNKKVLSWGSDSRPNLFAWDVDTGNILMKGNGGSAWAASVSPNNQYIAISAASLTLAIFNANTFEIIALSANALCCTNQMSTLTWSNDGTKIVTGSLNGLVTIWDAKTAKIIQQFKANPYYQADSRDISDLALSWVRDVTFSADNANVLAISGDGSIKEWDSGSGRLIQEKQLKKIASAKFSLYAGRLLTLDPGLLPHPDSIAGSELTVPAINISAPLASISYLESLAESCGVQSSTRNLLTVQPTVNELQLFVTKIATLNDTQIPSGCKADLLVLVKALMAKAQ